MSAWDPSCLGHDPEFRGKDPDNAVNTDPHYIVGTPSTPDVQPKLIPPVIPPAPAGSQQPSDEEEEEGPMSGIVVVQISGVEDGGGKYSGVIFDGSSSANETEDLTMPEGLMAGEEALVLNLEEDISAGNSGTHWLDVGAWVIGRVIGEESLQIEQITRDGSNMAGIKTVKKHELTSGDKVTVRAQDSTFNAKKVAITKFDDYRFTYSNTGPEVPLKADNGKVLKVGGRKTVAVTMGRGAIDSPTVLGDTSEGSETADTNLWSCTDMEGGPLDVWMISRVVYNHAGDKKLYAFMRKQSYAADGRLIAVSAETRVEVDSTGPCP